MVSSASMFAMGVAVFLITAVPFLTYFLLRKKVRLELVPIFAGFVFCVIFVMVLEKHLNAFILGASADGTVSLARRSPFLFVLYGTLSAGIFEESARFIAFHLLKKKYTSAGTAVAYGIGHGGAELLLIYALTQFSNLMVSFQINQHHLAGVSSQVVHTLTSVPSLEFLVCLIEIMPSFFLQLCFSVMVWQAVNRKGKIWLFPLAIFFHVLVNIPAGLWQAGVIHDMKEIYVPLYLSIVLVPLLLFISYRLGVFKQERRAKSEAYQNLLLYSRELESLNDELSVFKHDYINILMTMEESFHAKDYPQAETIFYNTIYPTREKIQGQQSNIQKYAKIRIQELRNILISKELHAREKGVKFQVEVFGVIEDIQVENVELIRGVSILLDNAIEATIRAGNCDTVVLSLMKVEQDFSFSCRNCINGLEFDRERLFEKNYSTKEDIMPVHGIGLYSLNQILDRNPFMGLKTKYKDGFITQVIFIKGDCEEASEKGDRREAHGDLHT